MGFLTDWPIHNKVNKNKLNGQNMLKINTENKNIGLLSAAQAVVGSQQALIMSVGALVGMSLAPDPTLATLPVTAMVFGLALTAAPATFIIHRLGRTKAFMLGASLAIIAGVLGFLGIILSSFLLFCIALAFGGASAAFGNQYRFAAADSVSAKKKGSAISWVLAGGILAGFIGPALGRWGRELFAGAEYAGSFLALSGVALIGVAILSQTSLPKAEKPAEKHEKTPFFRLISSPDIFVPIISGIVSYGIMVLIMVAAPLAMVVMSKHSHHDASMAISWHIIFMYAPSIFTAFIISKIGARALTAIGLIIILASVLVSLNGMSLMHFNITMILLGIGWNFGFIGSTALLSQGYRPQDSARAQAMNEQLVFGTMAVTSVTSGILLQTVGWQALNLLAVPVILTSLALLAYGAYYAKKQISLS